MFNRLVNNNLGKERGSHDVLFSLGVISICAAIGLFVYTLYILPYLLFNWNYTVPDFIMRLSEVSKEFPVSVQFFQSAAILLPFLIASLSFLYVANRINEIIEKDQGITDELKQHEHGAQTSSQEGEVVPKKPSTFKKDVLPILLLMFLIIAVLFFVEYSIRL